VHWAEIYGWPQHWVALNETTHLKGTKLTQQTKPWFGMPFMTFHQEMQRAVDLQPGA